MKIKLVNGNTYNADMVTDYNITMTVDLNDVSVILSDMTEDNMKKIELLDGSEAVCGEYVNKALEHAELNGNGVLVLILYDTVLPSEATLNILSGGAAQMTVSETIKMREMIEKVSVSMDDKEASEFPTLLPGLKDDGSFLEAGSRINWRGVVKRAKVGLWQRVDQNPDNAPDLWDDILYKDGIRIIPAVITSELKFGMDELGWWSDGLIYQSKLEVNTWTPAEYPDGWKLCEEG